MGTGANNLSPLFTMASTLPVWNDTQGFTGTLQYVDGSTVIVVGGEAGWFKKADVAALRAEATAATHKVAVVDDIGGFGAGIFRWEATSVLADDGTTVIAPDDGGPGRWIRLV